MPVLHDWYIKYNEGSDVSYLQAWGTVEGHQKQPDGTFIHTSKVKGIRLTGETLIVETLNNTYTLNCKEMNRDFLSDNREAIKRAGLTPKEWDIITSLSIQAFIEREQTHRDYRNKLKFGEIYMILSTEKPNGVDEIYFGAKEENGDLYVATCQFSVHLGMITDSVLYYCNHANHTYDVLRFFPHAPNHIEFYHTWDGKQAGVWGYFRNVGKHEVHVELPWGKEITVQPNTEIKISFDDGVGKDHVAWLTLNDFHDEW